MTQEELFTHLYAKLQSLQTNRLTPLRIAINGIEGTGKTMFAVAFTSFLQSRNEEAIHVSIDGFHFNRPHRYRQGRDSADGYYEDSYDEESFVEKVLKASQASPPQYISATHDLKTDEYLRLAPIAISPRSILITDGAYLFKSIYRPHWDFTIYLKTDFETARERGATRDSKDLGGFEAASLKFQQRYHAASQRYINENQPESFADFVIDNTDFEDLQILS